VRDSYVKGNEERVSEQGQQTKEKHGTRKYPNYREHQRQKGISVKTDVWETEGIDEISLFKKGLPIRLGMLLLTEGLVKTEATGTGCSQHWGAG